MSQLGKTAPTGLRCPRVRRACVLFAAALSVLFAAPARGDEVEATIFRVFLTDGTAVASYGEYARVGDRVVFSMPLGALPGMSGVPRLHLVNLPAAAIDWINTDRYAESARRTRYGSTRGETDFALLSAEVARALNEIALTSDPARRLDIARQARRTLVEWPQAHYGYRQEEVRQIAALLDEAISELRAAAGATEFDLSFVATAEPPPSVPVLANPTPAETIAQALTVARLTDVPSDRVSLLRSVVAALDDPKGLPNPKALPDPKALASLEARPGSTGAVPAGFARRSRETALEGIAAELEIERAYGELSRKTLAAASARAARAEVKSVETILRAIRRRDARLGRKRPEQVDALVSAVEALLDAARQLRLARDRWALRVHAFRAYRGAVKELFDQFTRLQPSLDDIKTLAGPELAALSRIATRVSKGSTQLSQINPPEELKPPHALLSSAWQLAASAVRIRREAVTAGNFRTAWDASAAAAGSMMLFARARADIETMLKLPQLR